MGRYLAYAIQYIKMLRDEDHSIQKNTKFCTISYQLHNSTINAVNHCKYLEVVLQSDLQWSKHIEENTAEANSTLA